MALTVPAIHRTEVDGVPTFVVPGPERTRAVLHFRVGRADESLPESGITHLTEHLALWALGRQAYSYNGGVGGARTTFWAEGTAEEVASFMDHVCQALAQLPTERIELERSVLRTEAGSRQPSALDLLFSLRFGAQGYGQFNNTELGLFHLDGGRVQTWANQWFTRGNAVLWITGEVPPGLRLPLPDGVRMPSPSLRALDLALPCHATRNVGGMGVGMLGEPSVALGVAAQVAAHRGMDALRYQQGIAYHVAGTYLYLSSASAHISVWTDCDRDKAARVCAGTIEVLRGLAETGATEAEMRAEINEAERAWGQEGAAAGWLDTVATRELNGEPPETPFELIDKFRQLPPAAVGEAIRGALNTAIYLLPPADELPQGMGPSYPIEMGERVQGTVVPHALSHLWSIPPVMIVSEQGMTLSLEVDRYHGIRFDDCVASLHYENGAREVMCINNTSLVVNPIEWDPRVGLVEWLDRHVPPQMTVQLPADIESPRAVLLPKSASPAVATSATSRRARGSSLAVTGAVVVLLVVGARLVSMSVNLQSGSTPSSSPAAGGSIVLMLALFGLAILRLMRRL